MVDSVYRGSRKLNFTVPRISIGELKGFDDHIYQPAMKKIDVIFFSEATVHDAMAWKRDEQRRLALYRFAPSNFAYEGLFKCLARMSLKMHTATKSYIATTICSDYNVKH